MFLRYLYYVLSIMHKIPICRHNDISSGVFLIIWIVNLHRDKHTDESVPAILHTKHCTTQVARGGAKSLFVGEATKDRVGKY
jgi:hypothetical protein